MQTTITTFDNTAEGAAVLVGEGIDWRAVLHDSLGWRWTFSFLSPGPAVGIVAMLRLLRLPEHELIAGGRG